MTLRRRALSLFAVAIIAALAGPASSASARSSYCSPTGDYTRLASPPSGQATALRRQLCTSAVKRGGGVILRVRARRQYFKRYKLCVSPPTGGRTCRTFRLRRQGGAYGSSIRWSRHFPDRGRGTYRVAWVVGVGLGPVLDFRP